MSAAVQHLLAVASRVHDGSWDASNSAVFALGLVMLVTWLAGVATKNYSQVDKIWSLTPALFAWIYAFSCDSPRVTLMAAVISFWSARLTLNFNRRGGYEWPPWRGEEDYRWAHVRKWLDADRNVILWEVFHALFIIFYQNLLLFLIVVPVHAVWHAHAFGTEAPLRGLDWLTAALILGLVIVEWHTDDVQYVFQETKYAMLKAGVKREDLELPYRDGFLSTGVFGLSRHMNYFCEQSIWVVLNVFVYTATGKFSLEAAVGGILLCALFQGSIWLQESTTKAKWPLYAEYCRQVPQLFPYGRGFQHP